MTKNNDKLVGELSKIREILDNHFSRPKKSVDWNAANAFMWKSEEKNFKPVENVNAIPLELLKGIDNNINLLFENTNNFSKSLPANNALLWGSRGMGKSSLVKGVHAKISSSSKNKLILIEIHREDIKDLPDILNELKQSPKENFIVFCDDLSFDNDDTTYKSLKTALEGGIEGRPKNVIFYATSNRRHLMPRDMIENERSSAIHTDESVEEKISLSDRFGLWIGFHNISQNDFVNIIFKYCEKFKLPFNDKTKKEAIKWSLQRGNKCM